MPWQSKRPWLEKFTDFFKKSEQTKQYEKLTDYLNAKIQERQPQIGLLHDLIKDTGDGLATEGIFRESGDSKRVKELTGKLISGKEIEDENIHNLTGAYKGYLRNLKDNGTPLIPEDVSERKLPENTNERKQLYQQVFEKVSPENKPRLRELLDLMILTMANKDINKMVAENLATVIAPNIFPDPKDPLDILKQNTFFTQLLTDLGSRDVSLGELFGKNK